MGQGQRSLVTGSQVARRVISQIRRSGASKQTSAERTTAAALTVNQQIVPQQISGSKVFSKGGGRGDFSCVGNPGIKNIFALNSL